MRNIYTNSNSLISLEIHRNPPVGSGIGFTDLGGQSCSILFIIGSQQRLESNITLSSKGTIFIPRSSSESPLKLSCQLYHSDLSSGNITSATGSITRVSRIQYQSQLYIEYSGLSWTSGHYLNATTHGDTGEILTFLLGSENCDKILLVSMSFRLIYF